MKVYLDDERATPEGWTRVYWPNEAIRLLDTGTVEEISLDQDSATMREERATMSCWIEQAVALRGFRPPKNFRTLCKRVCA